MLFIKIMVIFTAVQIAVSVGILLKQPVEPIPNIAIGMSIANISIGNGLTGQGGLTGRTKSHTIIPIRMTIA